MLGWPWFRFDGWFCSEAKGRDCKGTSCENSWTKRFTLPYTPGILHQHYMSRQAPRSFKMTVRPTNLYSWPRLQFKSTLQPESCPSLCFARFPYPMNLSFQRFSHVNHEKMPGRDLAILPLFTAIKLTEELQLCGACESMAMALEKFP